MKLTYTLQDAIEKCSDGLAIFAKENGPGGSRYYLVASRENFWKSYVAMPVKKHYEVIVDGTRCKLYFDLEYIKGRLQKNEILSEM